MYQRPGAAWTNLFFDRPPRFAERTECTVSDLSFPMIDVRRASLEGIKVSKARSRELLQLIAPPVEVPNVPIEEEMTLITNGIPVRWPLTRSAVGNTGYHYSIKDHEMKPFESGNECFTYALLDVDPSVRTYLPQPLELRLPWDGLPRRHIPDVYVLRDVGPCIIDVKGSEQAEDPVFETMAKLLYRWFAARDIDYFVWDEHHVKGNTRCKNGKKLLWYRRIVPTQDDRLKVGWLLELGPLTIADLASRLDRPRARSTVYALILRGYLEVDLDQPLTDGSLVQLYRRSRA